MDRATGSIDAHLNPVGRQEGLALGQQIAQNGGVDMITSSPLSRASEMAALIHQANPGAAIVDSKDGLTPWNLGLLEGHPEEYVNSVLKPFIDHPDKALVGASNQSTAEGESFNSHLNRYLPTLRAMKKHVEDNPDVRLLGVTHSRNIRYADAWLKAGAGKGIEVNKTIAKGNAGPEPGSGALYKAGPKGMIKHSGKMTPGLYLATHGQTDMNV